jgi:hypothetical protein
MAGRLVAQEPNEHDEIAIITCWWARFIVLHPLFFIGV